MAKRELNLNKEETKTEIAENIAETPAVEEKKEPVIGVVFGCTILRVRKKPALNADIVKEVKAGAELKILDDKNPKFYKLEDGYCVKDYIKIKPAE